MARITVVDPTTGEKVGRVTVSDVDGTVRTEGSDRILGWLLPPFGNRTGWVSENRSYRPAGHRTRKEALHRLWSERR